MPSVVRFRRLSTSFSICKLCSGRPSSWRLSLRASASATRWHLVHGWADLGCHWQCSFGYVQLRRNKVEWVWLDISGPFAAALRHRPPRTRVGVLLWLQKGPH